MDRPGEQAWCFAPWLVLRGQNFKATMPQAPLGSSPGLSQFHLAKLPRRRFSLSEGGTLQHLGAFIVGIVVGFLGGLFGKGGSAIATPLLSLVGYPGFIAVASPLPATIPGTLVASEEYWQFHLLDWQIVWWSIAVGIPATILGSLLTKFTGARPLLIVTGILVLGFGLSFLLSPTEKKSADSSPDHLGGNFPAFWRLRLLLIAAGVGIVSGLLANAGGFLLAPAYARFLRQPIKKSFACSLAVSAVLALPGTVVHAYLGHISWTVTGLVALGSVPFSYLGARIAIRTKASRLERLYGIVLIVLGAFFLYQL
jgi:uncharacterized membrane protein YfcA